MKTAEEFLKEKGIKDTLYDVNNPIPNNWIKGGLSALLDEYRNQPTPTSLPSDEEIQDNAERVPDFNFDEEEGYVKGAIWMRSICQAKLAESEREMKEFRQLARLISALNEDHENFKCIAGHIQLARKLLTTTNP